MKKYLILSLFCVVSPFVSVDAMDVEHGSERQLMIQELEKFQRIRPELEKMVAEEERKGIDLAKERADWEVESEKLDYIREVYSDLSDSLEGLRLESFYSNFKSDLDESLRERNEEEDKAVVSRERLLSTALSIDLYKCMFDLMREGFTQTVKGQVNALLGHAGSLLDGAAYKAFSEVGWLEKQLNDVRTAKAELQMDLDDAQAALEQQSTANAELQEQFRDKSDANVGLRSQLEGKEAELKQQSNANSANDNLQQQLESAKAELEEKRTANVRLRSQLGNAKAELEKQRNAQAALEKESNANAELQKQFEAANAALEQQLESAKAELEQQRTTNAELRSQFEAANAKLKKQLDDANAKLEQQSTANNANDDLQKQLDNAKAELEKQRNAKAELQKQLDHAKEVDAKVREKLLLIGEENKQVEAKIAGLEKQAELLPSLIAVSQSVIQEFITAKNAPLTENEKAKLRQLVSIIERLQQLTGQQIAAGLGSINPIAFDSSEGGK